jgi:hypothetical protein
MYITFRDCWPGVARRLPLRGSAGCVRLLPRPNAVRRPGRQVGCGPAGRETMGGWR